MSCSSSDFDALAEVLGKVRGVEDFIFYRFSAIDDEGTSHLCLNCFFLGSLLFGFGLLSGGRLFCGHEINL